MAKKKAARKMATRRKKAAPKRAAPKRKAAKRATAAKRSAPKRRATVAKRAPAKRPAVAKRPARRQTMQAASPAPMGSVQDFIKKFGIYLNAGKSQVVRINSPYWFPPAPEWVFLTPEVNMTLLKIRELAKGKVKDAEQVMWTSIPPKPEDLKRWDAEDKAKKEREAKEKAAAAKAAAKQ
ncbi:MAG: hypothetical protein HY261_01620 [Chloroflexi bacterium]|nr:hypothetical protein [Chloroflexota bacterium]